jgi:hypothetical protein
VIRLALVALVLSGCRTHHLGPDTGAAYRAALADQRDSGPEGPRFGADDATAALAARRRAAPRAPAIAPASPIVPPAAPAPAGEP